MPRSPRFSKREFCDEIRISDMNICNEVIKYMSISDLYRYFGNIPTRVQLLEIKNQNLDEFLELLELLILDNVQKDDLDILHVIETTEHILLFRSVKLGYLRILNYNHNVFRRNTKSMFMAYGGYDNEDEEYDHNDLLGAIAGGHIKLVKKIISRGEYVYGDEDIFDTVLCAGASGNLQILREIMKLNGIDKYRSELYMLKYALEGAAMCGHMNIVREVIKLGGVDDFNQSMINAAKGGHMNIVQRMIKLGADDFNGTMAVAAIGGHINIIREMLALGATSFNETLGYAVGRNYYEAEDADDIEEEMITPVPNNMNAVLDNRRIIVQEMLQLGAFDFNEALIKAAEGGHMEFVQEMIRLGANNFNRAMNAADKYGHMDIVREITRLSRRG
jgi:ankyrin repeat protein